MLTLVRSARIGFLVVAATLLQACGGGGDGQGLDLNGSGSGSGSGSTQVIAGPAANVATVVVDAGPAGLSPPALNIPYVTVRVCVPGTTQCQDIDHVEVDTGSYGLRLFASALSITLPHETDSATGQTYAECTEFGDGFSWGPMASADVQISGETAGPAPVQIIGDSAYSTIPSTCTGTAENTVQAFGANGIIGVGPFALDCPACVTTAQPAGSNTGVYYLCPAPGATCTESTMPAKLQAVNPVSLFQDSNGVILELPAVPAGGQPTATGALVFGIGTATNNGLGSAAVIPTDGNGYVSVNFNGVSYSDGYLDSGSNFSYFTDSNLTGNNVCGSGSSSVYCPNPGVRVNATLVGHGGSPQVPISFLVDDANTIFSTNPNWTAFSDVAAPVLSSAGNPTPAQTFDLGLPFFFGRNVFTAIENATTPGGPGPYFAF